MGNFSFALAARPVEGAQIAAAGPDTRARALVTEYFDFVWRLLRRLGVPERDVDDAAQQVFIVGAQRLTDIPIGSERTFLYGTALRTAATLRRNQRRRDRFIEASAVETEADERTPEDALERRRALRFLDTVLQRLGDDEREVFVLCEIEELNAPQVAAIVGIPVGTVASRLRRGRRAFAEQLERLKARQT